MTVCIFTAALVLLAAALKYGRFQHEKRQAERAAERSSRGGAEIHHREVARG